MFSSSKVLGPSLRIKGQADRGQPVVEPEAAEVTPPTLDVPRMNSHHRSMKSVVSEKGQVTIPKQVRDKLGLRPGTMLEFEAVEGRLIGVKREVEDLFRKWLGKGRIPDGQDVDSYLREVRG